MNISKNTTFLVVLSLSSSFAFTKSQVVQSDIFYEIKNGNIRAVKTWLKTNPDLSVKNDQGQSVLGYAVIQKKTAIIKFLIKAGVNVNQVDAHSKTALDYAVEQKKGSMCVMLVHAGAKLGSSVYLNDLNLILKKQTSVWKKMVIGVGITTLIGAFFVCLAGTGLLVFGCLMRYCVGNILGLCGLMLATGGVVAGTCIVASRVKYNRLKGYDLHSNYCLVYV